MLLVREKIIKEVGLGSGTGTGAYLFMKRVQANKLD
jgi:hypothetical protein